ncbi:MAG: insulinase family protein [Muribaculaceae bacterium]|nr:insulinase family protein [Muribaculaceae bacterium]
MQKGKLLRRIALVAVVVLTSFHASAYRYNYTTVEGDPMHSLIYTLPNGLKVYMSVNKDVPRIQTYIPVRVGGKNDPAETTGLAHYFEHLMFKGTEKFGTSDYAAEKPMLDEIEHLFEVYRKTTDEAERAALYKQIDSVSYEASKIAIPNEYDKLMTAIGAKGTNAYTSYDVTCYVEDIPSNQIENWARIQADRFENPVIRGFHTELETIYEEKNMSLTKDVRKLYESMWQALTPNHPYGSQTVLGTQEHLKNPSITNVKNYHKQWYVPNNMAICVAGDFDPDNMVDIITKYFGHLKPNPNLPVLNFEKEAEITEPIVKEVWGNEAEQVLVAWRTPGLSDKEAEVAEIMSQVLQNGKAGLLDLNVNQKQRVLGSYSGTYGQADYSAELLVGRPNEGQSLDDVKDILLAEVKNLREGNFDDEMLQAIINNFKLYQQQTIESNNGRANMFVQSFVNGTDWADDVNAIERQSKLTKKDIVDFANKYLKDNNYVVIYKRQGPDANEKKIAKPALTPIEMNRDKTSAFLTEIQNTKVEPIEPQFINFNKDVAVLKTKRGIPVLYKQNENNDLFSLTYVYDLGSYHNKTLDPAADLLEYLGAGKMSAAEVKNEFYRLACEFSVSVGGTRSYVTLTGLSENMEAAINLFETLLAEASADNDAYAKMVARIMKSRNDAKSNQSSNFTRLSRYAFYGANNPSRNVLSEDELKNLSAEQLTAEIAKLNSLEHRILYYGPMSEKAVLKVLNNLHRVPKKLNPVPAENPYKLQETDSTIIFLAPYKAKQVYMGMVSYDGDQFDLDKEAIRRLYNEYFGGGMNSIVFQEMRESRSLAYTAQAQMQNYIDRYGNNPYYYTAFIATQNDKLMDAIKAFDEIINDMPVSDAAFDLAKNGLDTRLRTQRTIKENVLWSYLNAQDSNLKEELSKTVYDGLQNLTFDDVQNYQKSKVKNRKYNYYILGDIEDLDIESLKKIGKVVILSTEDIFGY